MDYEANKDWQLLKHTFEQLHTSSDIHPYMLDILEQARTGQATFGLAKAFQILQKRVLWTFDGGFHFCTDLGWGFDLLTVNYGVLRQL